MFRILSLGVCALFVLGSSARADDWPQWLGPKRDSVWREAGVVQSIPAAGLKTKWRVPVGQGYSTPSVVDGVIYLTDFTPKSDKKTDNPGQTFEAGGTERVMAIDAETGQMLWQHEYPETYTISYPGGPRSQPTVADGTVYAIGAQGKYLALDAKSGKVLWEKDLTQTYKTKPPQWGYASSPLVDGNLIYANAGNTSGVAVALDRKTGQEVWRALPARELGYAPPTLIEYQGKRQLLFYHADGLEAVEPETGKKLWSVPIQPDHGMAITPPRQSGNLLFVSGAPRQSLLLKLTDGAPSEVWRHEDKKGIHAANAAPFIDNAVLYGTDALSGAFRGVRLFDGEQLWETFKPTTGSRRAPYGTAFVVKNEKNKLFYIYSETGDLILAQLGDDGYKEVGRQHLVDPSSDGFGREVVWSHPAFADRSVFVRNDRELVRYDLSKDSYPDGGPAAGTVEAAETQKATLEEAGTHVLTMTRFGLMAYFDLMRNKEQARQFTKNDLWTHVDAASVHKDVFPSISYLYSYFPDNFAADQKTVAANTGKPAGTISGNVLQTALKQLSAKFQGKGKEGFIQTDAFLDQIEQNLTKLEDEYRKTRTGAKPVEGPSAADFKPTKENWYPKRTDQDPELWKIYSQMSALEYYLYRTTEMDIDLTQKYKTEVSVRVRDPKSKKTLEDYFKWSSNPKRAIDLARRMAKLEKRHLELYGLYTPMRELLIRFLAYHWEFHDLLMPEEMPQGLGVVEPDTHSGDKP